MREMMPYIWIGIIIFSAVAGISAFSRVSLRLIPAGLTVFILSLSGAEVWQQALLFFILAPVLFILFRTLLKKFTQSKSSDSLIGRTAIVMEEINNYKETGSVRINGAAHTAKSEEDGVIYETGLVVTVTGFEGIKAVCSR